MSIKKAKFLVTGSSGQLAAAFISKFEKDGISYAAPGEGDMDITSKEAVEYIIDRVRPDVLINCAAYNKVEEAETEQEKAYAVNSAAAGNLARICKEKNILFVHYSSDYVFDGNMNRPYREDDVTSPLNVYGNSKLEGEKRVISSGGEYLIFRLSWVYGDGEQNFLYKLSQWAKEKSVIKVSEDEVSVPTFTHDAAYVTLLSIDKGSRGLYHLTNSGYCSRYELAVYFAGKMSLGSRMEPVPAGFFPTRAERPLFSAMSNEKISGELGISIPDWKDAVDRFIGQRKDESGSW